MGAFDAFSLERAEGLMGDHDTGQQRLSRRFSVELSYEEVDETGDIGKQSSIVPEEGPQRFRNRKDEMAMRQIQQHLLCEVLGDVTVSAGAVATQCNTARFDIVLRPWAKERYIEVDPIRVT